MKRLYYLSPSIDSAESVSHDLHRRGITDWNFHIVSSDENGLYRHQLHSASAFQKTDVLRFTERGLMSGGLVGLLFLFPLTHIEQFSFQAWLVITTVSMFFGAWLGGVNGLNTENYRIKRFHKQIQAGKNLIMVDVKKEDEQRIMAIMSVRHPEAELQGFSARIVNPFTSDDAQHIQTIKI